MVYLRQVRIILIYFVRDLLHFIYLEITCYKTLSSNTQIIELADTWVSITGRNKAVVIRSEKRHLTEALLLLLLSVNINVLRYVELYYCLLYVSPFNEKGRLIRSSIAAESEVVC